MTDVTDVPKPARLQGFALTAVLLGAVALGLTLGFSAPTVSAGLSVGVDPTLLVLVGLLFFELRVRSVMAGFANLRFIALVWGANFVAVPLIGVSVASVFLSGQPLLYTGLLIYFLAPCTDWFLSFTRMARGDTALGAALLPINMMTQLLLLPLWLWVLTWHTGVVDVTTIPQTMLQWFVLPFIAAQVVRWVLERCISKALFEMICRAVGLFIPWVTAALILQIFAVHTPTIAANFNVLGLVALAIFVFFVATFLLSEGLGRAFGLPYPQQALLAITTAARNAPLMLAVTALAIPDEPLIYAALVIGMLVEFPHLTALTQALLVKAGRFGAKH